MISWESIWRAGRKTLGFRLRSTNLSPLAVPRSRTRVVEVGGGSDDRYSNLTDEQVVGVTAVTVKGSPLYSELAVWMVNY